MRVAELEAQCDYIFVGDLGFDGLSGKDTKDCFRLVLHSRHEDEERLLLEIHDFDFLPMPQVCRVVSVERSAC